MFLVSNKHDSKQTGQEFGYSFFGKRVQFHEAIYDIHLRHDMLNST